MLTFEPFRNWCYHNKKKPPQVMADTNISRPVIYDIFNDRFPFNTKIIEKICKVYDLKVEQVICYKNDEDIPH